MMYPRGLRSAHSAPTPHLFKGTHRRKRYSKLLASCAVLSLLLLAGCGNDQNLTVVDQAASRPVAPTISLSSLDKLDDAYGRSWLSADEIIIDRGNRLIVHNAATGKEHPLTPHRKGIQLLAEASPDGKHVFFTEGVENDRYTIKGYILDIESGHIVTIGNIDMVNEFKWADNSHLISGTPDTGLQIIDLQGHKTTLKLQGDNIKDTIMQVQQVNGTIYFVGGSALNRVEEGSLQSKSIASDVWNFDVAPDGQSIVIQQVGHKESEPGKLTVIDNNGKVLGKVAEGTLLGRPAWSPDGSMLAFSIYQESQQGMKGLYIFNRSTGTTTPVTTEFQAYNTSIRWSPDNRRISLYAEDNGVVTALIGIDVK
ncbi:WD40 repeat domain-containing protein [Paenibacillus hunanensis]|uniref:WD40 repeat domain-containing protein n=1 Tax=Paenibacillus hunanensis TaxID=539262 RepID=UPI0020269D20|nr:WD40 repeat domain-containing protein [Paenibacillus hunanensis]MCL9662641.1 WD40 repeat domain-containing protein [Paenibacillus hunanensis]